MARRSLCNGCRNFCRRFDLLHLWQTHPLKASTPSLACVRLYQAELWTPLLLDFFLYAWPDREPGRRLGSLAQAGGNECSVPLFRCSQSRTNCRAIGRRVAGIDPFAQSAVPLRPMTSPILLVL